MILINLLYHFAAWEWLQNFCLSSCLSNQLNLSNCCFQWRCECKVSSLYWKFKNRIVSLFRTWQKICIHCMPHYLQFLRDKSWNEFLWNIFLNFIRLRVLKLSTNKESTIFLLKLKMSASDIFPQVSPFSAIIIAELIRRS